MWDCSGQMFEQERALKRVWPTWPWENTSFQTDWKRLTVFWIENQLAQHAAVGRHRTNAHLTIASVQVNCSEVMTVKGIANDRKRVMKE